MRIENVLIGVLTIGLFMTLGSLMYVDTMQKAGNPVDTTYFSGAANDTGVYVGAWNDTLEQTYKINDKLSRNSSISDKQMTTAELLGNAWDVLAYIPQSISNTFSMIFAFGELLHIPPIVTTFITSIFLIIVIFSIIYLIFIGRT